MAWRVAALAAFAALALPGTSAAPITYAAAADPGPLLGTVWEPDGVKLARVDPRSLEALPEGKLTLGRYIAGWAFSPDRSLLAVAAQTLDRRPVVRIIEVGPLRQSTAVLLRGYANTVAWPVANRVIAVASVPERGEVEVVVFEPLTQRVVRRTRIAGTFLRAARTPGGFVLLLGAPKGIGPARLVVADAGAPVRSTTLDVMAGWKMPSGQPYVFERREPGLAVDPDARRAYVVPAGNRVIEVDLRTLRTSSRVLSQHISMLGRLRSWLEPTAQAKAGNGPTRIAHWLGNGIVAVTGTDAQATVRAGKIERQVWKAAGLRLVDTRTWEVRTVDEQASSVVVGEGLLLATGSHYDSASKRQSSIGLVGYGFDGAKRFELFESRYPWVAAVFDGRAYVGFGGGPDQMTTIVDLATGGVVGKRAGIPPTVLVGAAGPLSG